MALARPAAALGRVAPAPPVHYDAGAIDEDIEEQVHVEHDHVRRKEDHHHVDDEIDEDINYDDDFEQASGGEDEEYQPALKAPSPAPPPAPPPEPEKPNKVTIRPPSSQSTRPTRPVAAKEATTVVDIKKALESENKKLAQMAVPPATPPPDGSRKKGVLADYESTMPKFNLTSGSSPSQRAAVQRLRDLKGLKVFGRFTVEKADLFQQRPQKDISLFWAGKSLKYCKLKSASSQTGDVDVEAGMVTDEVWTDDKEMQFPTLTMGHAGKAAGEAAQLLPFLRRVLPLFEASMSETLRRREASRAAQPGALQGKSGARASSLEANCRLPEGFVAGCLGAPAQICDLAVLPQWYGADHAAVLYCWPEAPRPAGAAASPLAGLARRLRSIVALYPVPALSALGAEGATPRPARCLYSFCRLTSITTVEGRPHIIVAGSEMGSLLAWDLRLKPHAPPETTAGEQGAAGRSANPELANLEGPVWLPPAYSTDLLAFSRPDRPDNDEDDDLGDGPSAARSGNRGSSMADLGDGGLHIAEICCVRCSDAVGGDALVFALDLAGVVSFWRILELASTQNVRLALQGSLSLAAGCCVLGNFLGASYLCIHPQQQAQFIVVSTSGLRQAHRKRASSIADGPNTLELVYQDDGELGPSPFLVQPCSAAFNPFLPGLLLVAYAEGDLALFDNTICVPVVHWGSAVPKAPSQSATVAWSTRRPCVFFVKSGDVLDVWDLADKPHAPVLTVDLAALVGGGPSASATAERLACADLCVGPDGRPLVGLGGAALVVGLPEELTSPLQTIPGQHAIPEKPVDELVVGKQDRAPALPTLSKHRRTVAVPPRCAVEHEVLRRVLAGIQPLQAAV